MSGIEDKILTMYSMGTSTKDIKKVINEIYGVDLSDSMISRITDIVLPLV